MPFCPSWVSCLGRRISQLLFPTCTLRSLFCHHHSKKKKNATSWNGYSLLKRYHLPGTQQSYAETSVPKFLLYLISYKSSLIATSRLMTSGILPGFVCFQLWWPSLIWTLALSTIISSFFLIIQTFFQLPISVFLSNLNSSHVFLLLTPIVLCFSLFSVSYYVSALC